MTRPSILIVSNLLSGSVGVRAQSEELADRLASAGHPVIATSTRLARVPRLMDMVSTAWTRRRDYDVAMVDIFSGAAFRWAECVCAALRLAGKPYVLGMHGGNLPNFAKRNGKRVRSLFSSAVAVVAPSPYLLKNMSAYRADILLIPNALDVAKYEFRVRETAVPKILWLRAFHKIYNPVMAVEAMHRLSADFPDVLMAMMGPDKHDGTLQATEVRISELQLADRISVQGRIPKRCVPPVMGARDIFINTSNIDNTPVTVVEAMAAGLCVVSTNAGGMPELIDDGQDGILVPVNDGNAMAAAIRRILTEPALAARLSRNARAKTELFDWSAVLPKWSALLGSAARLRPDAAPSAGVLAEIDQAGSAE